MRSGKMLCSKPSNIDRTPIGHAICVTLLIAALSSASVGSAAHASTFDGETSPEDIAGLAALKQSICGNTTSVSCLPSWDFSLPTSDPCLDEFEGVDCIEHTDYYDIIPALRIVEVRVRLNDSMLEPSQPFPRGASLELLTDFSIRCVASNASTPLQPLPSSMLAVWASLMPSLQSLRLPSCNLQGPLPCELAVAAPSLASLDLHHNQLSGPLPDQCWAKYAAQLRLLDLSYNAFDGTLPHSWQDLQQLKLLYLQGNRLHGSLPPGWGTMAELKLGDVSGNSLHVAEVPKMWQWGLCAKEDAFMCFDKDDIGRCTRYIHGTSLHLTVAANMCTHPEAPATITTAWVMWLLLMALAAIKAWQHPPAAPPASSASLTAPLARVSTPGSSVVPLRRMSSNGSSMRAATEPASSSSRKPSSSQLWWGGRSTAFEELAAPLLVVGSDVEDDSDAESLQDSMLGSVVQQGRSRRQGGQQGQQGLADLPAEQLLSRDPVPYSLRLCWMLLQPLVDCLLAYSWGLLPLAKHWPSLVSLAFVVLPHFLVALMLHVLLVAAHGQGAGRVGQWYYGHLLRARRQQAWVRNVLLALTSLPVVLLLMAAGPVLLLLLSLSGRGHLLQASYHLRLLHGLMSITEAPWQAVLLSVLYWRGNTALFQVYMDRELFVTGAVVAFGTMGMCWYALLAGVRAGRQDGPADVAATRSGGLHGAV